MRVTNAVVRKRRHKNILSEAKGFRGRKGKCSTLAKNNVDKKYINQYKSRRYKKRDFRSLWIIRLNAAARKLGLVYSSLICKLKEKNILLNRKMLSEMAIRNWSAFENLINTL
jgi:large subunit ribosomal protein L20